ncbi:DUF2029 domain-containing protein [Candidatus Bathyarchaeota archaeon]|nr:DUF2029 domain-containing protein [Candidatus Bathyarchaeota archaeon]
MKLNISISRIDRKVLLIIAISCAVHIPFLIYDFFDLPLPSPGFHGPDLRRYRARAEAILKRKIFYERVYTPVPPLISYVLLFPYMLGGWYDGTVYEAFFAFFNVLNALLLYYMVKTLDDTNFAYKCALFYALNPISYVSATIRGQDEPLVTFFLMLPLYFMLKKRRSLSAALNGIGIAVKGFSLLFIPAFLRLGNSLKERIKFFLLSTLIPIFIWLPFYINVGALSLEPFSRFVFEVSPYAERRTVSYSLLINAITPLPDFVYIIIAIVTMALVFGYIVFSKSELDIWKACTITMAVFLLTYPDLRTTYYLLITPFIARYATHDRRILLLALLFPLTDIWELVKFIPTAYHVQIFPALAMSFHSQLLEQLYLYRFAFPLLALATCLFLIWKDRFDKTN